MRISPSAYNLFHRCNRAWWFQKVKGLTEPPKDHLTLGTLVHAYMEHYLLANVKPEDAGRDVYTRLKADDKRFADQVKHYTDGPANLVKKAIKCATIAIEAGNYDDLGEVEIEVRFAGQCGPLPYLSFSDVVHEVDGMLAILDHKTSSNPNGKFTYPHKGSIEEDSQLLFYAKVASEGVGYKGPVAVAHSYIPTKGKQTRVEKGIASLEDIESNWRDFEATAQAMKDLADVEDPKEVAPTLSACSMYGGCPFRAACPSHAPQIGEGKMSVDKMNEIKARLAALKARNSKTDEDFWPSAERPPMGKGSNKHGEFTVLGFTSGGDIKLVLPDGSRESMTKDEFTAWNEPVSDTTIRPADAVAFAPSEKFEAELKEEATDTKSVDEIALEVHAHLLGTGLNPAVPYDAHKDDIIRDLVRDGLGAARRKVNDRRDVFTRGAEAGLWSFADDKLTGWAEPAKEELKEGLAEATSKAMALEDGKVVDIPEGAAGRVTRNVEPAAESGDRDRQAGATLPPPVQAPAVVTSTVLVDATCYGAVPLDNWMVFHNVEGRYQALASNDHELRGLPYYAAPFGKGKPAMTMVLVDAIRSGALKLPPYLEVSSGHPLAPTLVPALAEFHVLVVKGLR